eukprot:scaffold88086_cov67-Phaeocystis_antarctica.AAC.1
MAFVVWLRACHACVARRLVQSRGSDSREYARITRTVRPQRRCRGDDRCSTHWNTRSTKRLLQSPRDAGVASTTSHCLKLARTADWHRKMTTREFGRFAR